jgi:hyperosmotically inducible protein
MLQRCAAVLAAAIFTVACAQTDAGITTNVKTRLAADDTVKAYQVDVDTRNGVVTLSGDVESAAAKEQAIRIARDTNGVRDVIDQIHVGEAAATAGTYDLENRAERGAAELKEEGREAVDKAERGAAELKEESREAYDKAKTEGREAANKVGDAADKAGAVITDAAITTAVKAKFLADTTVKGLRIDVDTSGGMVTLNGTVSSRAEADRAMMLARNTEGVKGVHDNLKVGR